MNSIECFPCSVVLGLMIFCICSVIRKGARGTNLRNKMMNTAAETNRLILRRWRPEDLSPFAELNADPKVMEYFPSTLSMTETEAMIKTIKEKMEQHGFGLWAAELKETKQFIGFIGLNVPAYPLPFSPCIEIGWRLAFPFWGRGLAQEGARAALKCGFNQFGLKEIVSFTTERNQKSRNVMEKIGMTYDPNGDFNHPKLAEGHLLRKHVLYRLKGITAE